jgi:hypothetical protein
MFVHLSAQYWHYTLRLVKRADNIMETITVLWAVTPCTFVVNIKLTVYSSSDCIVVQTGHILRLGGHGSGALCF